MTQNTFHCNDLPYTDALRQVFMLSPIESIVVDVIGPVSLIFAIINIACIKGIKVLNEPPSDILLFITIFSMLKLLVFFTTMIYNDIYPLYESVPSNFNSFCLSTGIIDIIAESSKLVYTFVFCIYYITKIRNPLKAWISQHKQLHFLCIFIILLFISIMFFTGSIGVSLYGYCSIKFSSGSLFSEVGISFSYIFCLCATSFVFLKYLKKVAQADIPIHRFFTYYFRFLIIFCINQLILATSHLVIAIACDVDSDPKLFTIFQALAKVSASISPIFVFVVLISHPQVKKVLIFDLLRSIAKKIKLVKQERQNSFYDELMTTERNSVLIELNNLSNLQRGYITQFKDKNRACLLASILGCLVIDYKQKSNQELSRQSILRTSVMAEDSQDLFEWNYQEVQTFPLTDNLVHQHSQIFIHKLPVVDIRFVSYSPSVFARFQKLCNAQQLILDLQPILNENQIIADSQSDASGGRSGQFFFFNYNRTLIMKTISTRQKTVFLSRLQAFHKYYQNHSNSIIVKMLSLFSVINNQTEEEMNFVLMGNILKNIPKEYVVATYDLKGSAHQRRVIKDDNQSDPAQLIRSKTLKDLDFLKFEGQVWIKESHANFMKQIISQDANFLSQQGLIDYSLILIKIDIKSFRSSHSNAQSVLNSLQWYPSTKEQGICYLFGLIDYLQTWNIRKKGEKWYKSIFSKKAQISSQDPSFYCDRFINKLICTIFNCT